MANPVKQIWMMTRVNVASLRRRMAISLSMAFSVALAVCVCVGFLSLTGGFEAVLQNTGSPSVAVVLGGGTNQEIGSEISADAIRTLQATRSDIGAVRYTNGNLVMSQELVQPVVVHLRGDGTQRTLSLRGMSAGGLDLRDDVTITDGRMFRSGAREVAVGAQLAADFPGFEIGNSIKLGAVTWNIVGHYSAPGSVFESEIWTGLDAARTAFDRKGEVQTLRLRLIDPNDLEKLQAALDRTSNEPLKAVSETHLFSGQSERTTALIRYFGWPIALLMAVGATAGAINTMMSSVSDRETEIATVRALGFGRLSAFAATWIESVFIAAVGSAVGLLVSWIVFNGWQASTLGANNTRMSFQLIVDFRVMLTAALLGVGVGVIGGLLPALSATRVPIVKALRANT